MTGSKVRTVSAVALVALIGAAVFAQKPTTKPEPGGQQAKRDETTQLGILEVRLPIAAREKNKFVAGLTANNFEVYEDGKRQKIEKFIAPSQLPLNVAVLMDTSNSVKLRLPFEKEAAEDSVATVTTYRRQDQVLFATFDSAVELHQDFTDAQEPLVRAIRKVKAGGYTRLYDAVYRVIEEKMSNLQESDARRIIVVLSDGEDTASERTLREAIERAQRYDVTVFGVSTKNFSSGVSAGTVESSDDKELRRLCEETGGQLFLPSQKLELFRAFSQVAQNLRQEYIVFYTPQNQQKTGKRRAIKIKLIGADGQLYHKQGYTY
jgi:Ca-activated chloride channel family protein